MTSDRWVSPVSVLTLRGDTDLVRGANWAWAASWPGLVGSPATLLLFLFKLFFFFYFETKEVLFAKKIA
jgi:hypothetical protein